MTGKILKMKGTTDSLGRKIMILITEFENSNFLHRTVIVPPASEELTYSFEDESINLGPGELGDLAVEDGLAAVSFLDYID